MDTWNISFVAGYKVPPCYGMNEEYVQSQVEGSSFELDESGQRYFLPLFENGLSNNAINVAFETNDQDHYIRNQILALNDDNVALKEQVARDLALRLAISSPKSTRNGLLVIMAGKQSDKYRVVLWKFPANPSIQAELLDSELVIRVLDSAFSRDTDYFKAAIFEDKSLDRSSFLFGKIEDKQTRVRGAAALFWMKNFLGTRPQISDENGTRTIGRALRDLTKKHKNTQSVVSLLSAAEVAKSRSNVMTSIQDFSEHLSAELAEEFLDTVNEYIPRATPFHIVPEMLDTELGARIIILENNVRILGPTEEVNALMDSARTNGDKVSISIEQSIEEDKLKTINSLRG